MPGYLLAQQMPVSPVKEQPGLTLGIGIVLAKARAIEVVLEAVVQLADRRCQPQPLTLLLCQLIGLLIAQLGNPQLLLGQGATGFIDAWLDR
ncbi:hypothetical protein D3C80_951210 [compost metagenome]